MQQFLNTLYVTHEPSYVHLDHETLVVENNGKLLLQVPLHHLGAIYCFGNVLISPGLIAKCAEEGRSIALFDRNGSFQARIVGRVKGNILLRIAQYSLANNPNKGQELAKRFVAAKIYNCVKVLRRISYRAPEIDLPELRASIRAQKAALEALERSSNMDEIRGIEGEAARSYFKGFAFAFRPKVRDKMEFRGRTRRPPRDPVNAVLSFLYAILLNDCLSACEGVGLDVQLGFLHVPRPGRPSLGLDLMEEFRAIVVDRLVLRLFNRRELEAKHFHKEGGGAVFLNNEGRKKVVIAYQNRKKESVFHDAIGKEIPLGLAWHIQARLLARWVIGDLKEYLPWIEK